MCDVDDDDDDDDDNGKVNFSARIFYYKKAN